MGDRMTLKIIRDFVTRRLRAVAPHINDIEMRGKLKGYQEMDELLRVLEVPEEGMGREA